MRRSTAGAVAGAAADDRCCLGLCRCSFRFGSFSLGSGCRTAAGGGSRHIFAIGSQDGDHSIDLDAFGAGGNDELGNDAFVDGFDFHRRLVGFDLGRARRRT